MIDLFITDLKEITELLTDYKDLTLKQKVNGERSLSFDIIETHRNKHCYPLVAEEMLCEYKGQRYRIKKVDEKSIGLSKIKKVYADHVYVDLIDHHQYDTLSGTLSLAQALQFALKNTGYTYDIVDSFYSVEFENFGDENALALLQTILERYGAEFDVNNTHIVVKRQIGNKTDFQFRFKHNLKTIERSIDSTNLSTYIKGFGKQNDDGTYVVTAEYESPMSSIYGIRHASPVRDNRYTQYEALLDRLKSEIQDTPEISFTVDFTEMKKAGFEYDQLGLGDEIFVIYEPLGIDIVARVMEYTEYPNSPKSSKVTLANYKKSSADQLVDFARVSKQVADLFNGNKRLPYNVLDDAVRRSTEAMNNAMTELEFPPGLGIVARDPVDPNKFTALRSTGLGITKNNGASFDEAITADGFNLSIGAVGQLNANNIKIGPGTTFDDGYDPSTKETPEGAQEKASAAETNAKSHADGIKTELSQDISDVDGKVTSLQTEFDNISFDGVIDQAEAAAIKSSINILNTEKTDIDARYMSIYNNPHFLTDSIKLDLSAAKTAYDSAHGNLIALIGETISDGVVDETEKMNIDNAFTEYGTSLNALTTQLENAVNDILQHTDLELRNDLRLDSPLPNTILMNNEGIQVLDSDLEERLRVGEYEPGKYGIGIEKPDGTSVAELGNFDAGQYGIRVKHIDGTYTQLTDRGLERWVAGESKPYMYLTKNAQAPVSNTILYNYMEFYHVFQTNPLYIDSETVRADNIYNDPNDPEYVNTTGSLVPKSVIDPLFPDVTVYVPADFIGRDYTVTLFPQPPIIPDKVTTATSYRTRNGSGRDPVRGFVDNYVWNIQPTGKTPTITSECRLIAKYHDRFVIKSYAIAHTSFWDEYGDGTQWRMYLTTAVGLGCTYSLTA